MAPRAFAPWCSAAPRRLADARAFSAAVVVAQTEAFWIPWRTKKSAHVVARGRTWADVWAPSGKRLVLGGIRVRPEGVGASQVVRVSADMAQALRVAGWPTFNRIAELPADGWRLLGDFGRRWDFGDVAHAEAPDFAESARRAPPGPDGLPHTAWVDEGSLAGQTLAEVFWELTDGIPSLLAF